MKKTDFLKRLRIFAAIMGGLCCLLQASAAFAAPHMIARAACTQDVSLMKAVRAQSAEVRAFGTSAKKDCFSATPTKNIEVLSKASAQKDARRISSSSVRLSKNSYRYDGREKKPSVTVKYSGRTLKKGRDYSVSYKDNIKRGKAKVVVKAKGKYHGTVTVTFKIK